MMLDNRHLCFMLCAKLHHYDFYVILIYTDSDSVFILPFQYKRAIITMLIILFYFIWIAELF